MTFRYTNIWRQAFSDREPDDFRIARQRLSAAYERIWSNAVQLSNQIGRVLPGLTLHDESHFEALWKAADKIAGRNYQLSPLEVFVFGVAVLIHDAGHALVTFPGGLDELKQTVGWQDAVLAAFLRSDPENHPSKANIESPPEHILNEALFTVLRSLHASKAETLAALQFENKSTNTTAHLIEDDQIRLHLSRVIGIIAASHHWDIDRVAKLPRVHGVPNFAPEEWAINPLRLACLIRCADAIQIDQERAPDFSYAMLRLHGLSERHWLGQNRISVAAVDPIDSAALIFNSTRPFAQDDADAWWIIYEALKVADTELQNCAILMKDLNVPGFAISRVRDAKSPDRLSTHIEAAGWKPVNAEVRTGSTERVIGLFGGDRLYGNRPSVVLRETIQNAVDAVRARREAESDVHYQGRVTVRIERDALGGGIQGTWLHVEDDGIGMSEDVLTGPLIEFTTSYWNSDLIRSERPGLSAKVRRQTGKFGVGFFSVFMLTDRVVVTSRRFDAGPNEAKTLSFKRGLKSRPLLLETGLAPLSTSVSSRISLFLSNESLTKLQTVLVGHKDERKVLTFAQLLGHLCSSSDCDLWLTEAGTNQKIHDRHWHEHDSRLWLRRVLLADVIASEELDRYIDRIAPNLRKIGSEADIKGWAAVAYSDLHTGVTSIGGFISGHEACWPSSFSPFWIGEFGKQPEGPKRDTGLTLITEEERRLWSSEQGLILSAVELTDTEKLYASEVISHFGGDPTPVAVASLNRKLVTLDQLARSLIEKGRAYCGIRLDGAEEGRVRLAQIYLMKSSYYGIGIRADEIEFQGLVIEGFTAVSHVHDYQAVPTKEDPAPNSMLGCLSRSLSRDGYKMEIEVKEKVEIGRYIGPESKREGIVTNTPLVTTVLELAVEKI